MQNDAGEYVDLYIPRKCSSTNRIISAKDNASIQLNLVELDSEGKATGNIKPYCICGEVRRMGESDDSLNRLAQRDDAQPSLTDSLFGAMVIWLMCIVFLLMLTCWVSSKKRTEILIVRTFISSDKTPPPDHVCQNAVRNKVASAASLQQTLIQTWFFKR